MPSVLLNRLAARASSGYHPVYARLLLTTLEQRHIPLQGLLAEAGLREDDLAPSVASVSHAQLRRLMAAARKRCADPLLALEWGALIRDSMHGAASTAVLSSPNLRQAIHVIARMGPLRGTIIRPHLVETRRHAWIEIGEALPRDDLHDFLFSGIASMLAQMLASLLGPAARQLSVELPMDKPAWAESARHFFPGALRFGAKLLRFGLPTGLLERPCPAADPAIHAAALRLCELDAQGLQSSLEERVSSLLGWHSGVYPTSIQMARKMGMSARSFSRALEAEGTTYRALVERARRQAAHRLLRESAEAVEQIAVQLGYADTSNFIRAFRRWFGCTPQHYRHTAMDDAPVFSRGSRKGSESVELSARPLRGRRNADVRGGRKIL